MGLFGGSKSTSSTTSYASTSSQSIGDLSTNNNLVSGDFQQSITGFYGDDLQSFFDFTTGLVNEATSTSAKSAGDSAQYIATAYQNAYSGNTGFITHLKPVLLLGVSILAIWAAPKIWRKL
jgi:hypothetical protein